MNTAIEQEISKMKIGQPVHHGNMTVFPLNGAPKEEPGYVTLQRALKSRLVRIAEITESGSVPELQIVNKSDICVLLLDGEEVIGAKQNRVLNTTILLGAGTTTPIPVSCTEQGRWSYSSDEFGDSNKVMSPKLRSMKSKSVSYSLKSTASYHSNQGEVWEGISALHASAKTHSPTGAMSDVYEQRAEDLSRYEKAFPAAKGQRGLLVFVNGKPAGIDLLSRVEAYAELHPRLVRSYAMDAVADDRGETEPSSDKAAAAFVDCLNECQESRFKSVGLGDDLRYESPATVGSALVVDKTPVHMAFFRLEDVDDRRRSRRRESRVSSMELRRNYRRMRRSESDESSPTGED